MFSFPAVSSKRKQVIMLSGVEAIHVATVLEDCVDQLSILGRIMPASYEEKPDANDVSGQPCVALLSVC